MKTSFREKIGCADALKALQTYTQILDKKYGRKAFQRFSDADMHCLSQE
jgi:hypothetical protein